MSNQLIIAVFASTLFIAQALRLAKAHRSLEEVESLLAEATEELEQKATTDPLTRTLNRDLYPVLVEPELARIGRRTDGKGPTFMFLALANLDEVNHEHDYEAGDRVLEECSRRIRGVLRETDFIFRWSGNKFLIFCRDADARAAEILGNRILVAATESPFVFANQPLEIQLSGTWLTFGTPQMLPLEKCLTLIPAILQTGLDQTKTMGKNRLLGLIPVDRETAGAAKATTRFEHSGFRFKRRWLSAVPDIREIGRRSEIAVRGPQPR